jgi:predicted HNH restriction endonuclease
MAVDDVSESKDLSKENVSVPDETDPTVRNFDLNADVHENEETKAAVAAAQASSAAAAAAAAAAAQTSSAAVAAAQPSSAAAAAAQPSSAAAAAAQPSSTAPTSESKHEEYPGWSLSDVDKMAIDPLQLAQLSKRLDEDEEDYDEEG